jgi:hypothetical protein
MKNTILTLLLMALTFCAFSRGRKKIENAMNSWLGHSKHELVMSWGMPDRTSDDGNGGEIIAYAYGGHQQGVNWGNGIYTEPRSWYDYRIFFVNSDGKIYSWRTMRKNIPPQQIDLNIYHY